MDLVTLPYIFLCLVLVFFFFAIPPSVRRRYSKYDDFDKIKDISKKHNIMKPGYLMFNLDYQHEDSWFFRWISRGFEEMPRNTDDPILFLKKSIASIENKEEKKIYTEWLINQLSERAKKKSDLKNYYVELKKSIIKTYDNIEHLEDSTEGEINEIIENLVRDSDENNSSDYDIDTRRTYFKTFIEKPHLKRSNLVKVVCENNDIVDRDSERLLNDKPPSVLSSWEANLRTALIGADLASLAQKLER